MFEINDLFVSDDILRNLTAEHLLRLIELDYRVYLDARRLVDIEEIVRMYRIYKEKCPLVKIQKFEDLIDYLNSQKK